MGEDTRQVREDVTATDDAEALRSEIEETREELGDTVAALAHKTDVKARAKDKVAETRERVEEKKDEAAAKLRETKDDVAAKVQEKTPEPVQQRAEQVAGTAKANKKPLAIGAAVAAALLVLRRVVRRGHGD